MAVDVGMPNEDLFEEWRPIPGHSAYEVSNMGRVRSLDREITQTNGKTLRLRGRVLRPAPTLSGHLSVVLSGKSFGVHLLVMKAFGGTQPAGTEVLHGDHTPSNNRRSNLRYGTRSENIRDDYAVGTRRTTHVVATHPCGKQESFTSLTKAALAFGVSQPAATKAVQEGYQLRKSKVRLTACGI